VIHVRLFFGIVRHRVPWIRDTDEAEVLERGKDKKVIEEVKVNQWAPMRG
jgi:hypothetical protein